MPPRETEPEMSGNQKYGAIVSVSPPSATSVVSEGRSLPWAGIGDDMQIVINAAARTAIRFADFILALFIVSGVIILSVLRQYLIDRL